jgi:Transposase, Mutator family
VARGPKSSQALAFLRCRIVLTAAEGLSSTQIAAELRPARRRDRATSSPTGSSISSPPASPEAAALLDEIAPDPLAFTAFPEEHWRQLWSNKPLERLNKEIRRRTDMVGISPDRASIVRLVAPSSPSNTTHRPSPDAT